MPGNMFACGALLGIPRRVRALEPCDFGVLGCIADWVNARGVEDILRENLCTQAELGLADVKFCQIGDADE